MGLPEQAEIALRWVREAPLMAFDTETSGLDWKRNSPIGYVFAVEGQPGIYIPVRHGGGGNLPDPNCGPMASPTDPLVQHRFEAELSKAFQERVRLGHLTVGHHLKFDCHFAANAGILLGRNLSCTQNNEALLDEYAKSYSLDASAERRGVTAKKGEDLYQHIASIFGCAPGRKAMEYYWQMPGDDPLVSEYAAGDGTSTLELFLAQRKEIEEQELGAVFELENQLIWTLFRMERRGIRVDTDYLSQLAEQVEARVKEAYDALPPGFNVRSPVQVRQYVEAAGHTDWPTTEKGNPSFTERWLKTFPEGRNIVAIRKWTNLKNSFIGPLLESHVFEGRVHATFNQLKTDEYGTPARLSCSHPNLQQIPKRDKELAPMFRRGFVADPGFVFHEADWSQCEPRLFAHYSKEPALIEGYCQTPFRDMHQVVADMLGVERDPTAKRMNMGLLTGMFPKTFAEHMGWTVPYATEQWNRWYSAFPKVRDFQNMAKQTLQNRGYVRTLLGRRGRLEHPRFAYRAVSKIIQGGNADIMKKKLVDIDLMLESRGDETQLLATVHDSLNWQTPEGDETTSKEICDMMADVQSEPFNLRVPFVTDHSYGANWAEATFGGED